MTQDRHDFLSVAVEALVARPKPDEALKIDKKSAGSRSGGAYVLTEDDMTVIKVYIFFFLTVVLSSIPTVGSQFDHTASKTCCLLGDIQGVLQRKGQRLFRSHQSNQPYQETCGSDRFNRRN